MTDFPEFPIEEFRRALDEHAAKRVFVFGSDLAGRHGKGAALTARQQHGAIYGQGSGLQGNSYAVPTKDERMQPLTLDRIYRFVREFVRFAAANPDLEFKVTRVGCGLAGYTDEQITPFFEDAPQNCLFDPAWKLWLPDHRSW